MKPPLVHQPVQPPSATQPPIESAAERAETRPQSTEELAPDGAAADEGDEGKMKPVESRPGLVGGFGTMVDPANAERDGAGADERKHS